MSEEQMVIGPCSIRQQMVLQDEDTDTLLIGGGAGEIVIAPRKSNLA